MPDSKNRNICRYCLYYSEGEEYGLGPGSGYCEKWKKITRATDSCQYFKKKDKKTLSALLDDIPDAEGDEEAELEMGQVGEDILDINTRPPFGD